MSKSLPARLGYVLYSCVAGVILLGLVAGAFGMVQSFLDGGLNDSAARRIGELASHVGLGVGGALGALLGAFILKDSSDTTSEPKREESSRNVWSTLGLVWILAFILAGVCLYLAFGQGA